MAESKVVDKRNRSEPGEYGIGFASRSTVSDDYEHAFVVWFYSDNAAQRSNRKAAGFYPLGGDLYDLVIAGTSGAVFDDSKQNIEKELVVIVNSDVFEAARSVEKHYSDGTYRLGFNDCVTYVLHISETIPHLLIPSRLTNLTPSRFISSLFAQN